MSDVQVTPAEKFTNAMKMVPDSFKLHEYVSNPEIVNLIRKIDTSHPSFGTLGVEATEIVKIRTFKMNIKGNTTIEYRRPKYSYGRFYPYEAKKAVVSLQNVLVDFRKLIAGDGNHDIDIKNSHPVLLYQYCVMFGIKSTHNFKYLLQYIDHRDTCLKLMMEHYDTDRDTVKELMLCVMNGGMISTWAKRFKIAVDAHCPFPTELAKEVAEIRDNMATNELYKTIADVLVVAKKKKCETTYTHEITTLSILLQHLESIVGHYMIKCCVGLGLNVSTLIHDGILVQRQAGGPINEEVLEEIQEYVETHTGFKITLVEKPFKPDEKALELKEKILSFTEELGIKNIHDDIEGGKFLATKVADILKKSGTRMMMKIGNIWHDNHDVIKEEIKKTIASFDIWKIGVNRCMSKNVKGFNDLYQALLLCLPDDREFFDKMWASNLNYLFFSNGVYSFRDSKLYGFDDPEVKHVVTTKMINRDYVEASQEQIDNMNHQIWDRIFATKPELALFNKRVLARAMAGCFYDKRWSSWIGERDSGKGIITTLLQTGFGNYVEVTLADYFTTSGMKDKDHAKTQGWLMDYEYARLMITNEIKPEQGGKNEIKMDGNVIKSIASGGDTHKGRQLYQNTRQFNIQSSLIIMCNGLLEVSPQDTMENGCITYMPSKFYDQAVKDKEYANNPCIHAKDDGLKKRIIDGTEAELIDAFVFDLIKHYSHDKPKDIDDMKVAKSDFVEDTIESVLKNRYIITGQKKDLVEPSEVKNILADKKFNIKPNELVSKPFMYGVSYKKSRYADKELQKFYDKWAFEGLRLKEMKDM